MPTNPSAVHLLLTTLDSIPPSHRATLFPTKESQSLFWTNLTQTQKSNSQNKILPSELIHIPFERRIASYNDDELRRSFGYTLRDQKKEEFAALKGDRAMSEFFRAGSEMLKEGYLERIGYVRGGGDTSEGNVTPKMVDSSCITGNGEEQDVLLGRFRNFGPRAPRKRVGASTLDDGSVNVSSGRDSPTLPRARKIRKVEGDHTADLALKSSIQGQDAPDPDETIKEAFTNIREAIDKAVACFDTVDLTREVVLEIIQSLSSLRTLFASIFGSRSWDHIIADLMAGGHTSTADLLRCLLWKHIIKDIVKKDAPWAIILVSGPALTEDLMLTLRSLMTKMFTGYRGREELFRQHLAKVCDAALILRIRLGRATVSYDFFCPAHGQKAYTSPYATPDQSTAEEPLSSLEVPVVKEVLFTRVPGLCRKAGVVVIPAELRLQ